MLLPAGVSSLAGSLIRSMNAKKPASPATGYHKFLLTKYLGEKKMFEMSLLQMKAR